MIQQCQIAAVTNQKGGVGKTTLTINLGAGLADLGQRVLLIDMDAQGHLSEHLSLQDRYLADGPSLYDGLVDGKRVDLDDLIYRHPREGFAIIPSSYKMMLADQALYMARNREHRLKSLLSPIGREFDWVLIDCPPVLSNLTDNALNAARQVIIPIEPDPASVRALELLFDQIESVERGLNISIRVLAVVPNKVQDSLLARRILGELRQSVAALTPFELRKRVMLQEAWSKGCSIFTYQPDTTAQARGREELVEVYRTLARMVMRRAAEGDKHA